MSDKAFGIADLPVHNGRRIGAFRIRTLKTKRVARLRLGLKPEAIRAHLGNPTPVALAKAGVDLSTGIVDVAAFSSTAVDRAGADGRLIIDGTSYPVRTRGGEQLTHGIILARICEEADALQPFNIADALLSFDAKACAIHTLPIQSLRTRLAASYLRFLYPDLGCRFGRAVANLFSEIEESSAKRSVGETIRTATDGDAVGRPVAAAVIGAVKALGLAASDLPDCTLAIVEQIVPRPAVPALMAQIAQKWHEEDWTPAPLGPRYDSILSFARAFHDDDRLCDYAERALQGSALRPGADAAACARLFAAAATLGLNKRIDMMILVSDRIGVPTEALVRELLLALGRKAELRIEATGRPRASAEELIKSFLMEWITERGGFHSQQTGVSVASEPQLLSDEGEPRLLSGHTSPMPQD